MKPLRVATPMKAEEIKVVTEVTDWVEVDERHAAVDEDAPGDTEEVDPSADTATRALSRGTLAT